MRERAYDLEAKDLHSSPGQSLLAVSSSKSQSTFSALWFLICRMMGFQGSTSQLGKNVLSGTSKSSLVHSEPFVKTKQNSV